MLRKLRSERAKQKQEEIKQAIRRQEAEKVKQAKQRQHEEENLRGYTPRWNSGKDSINLNPDQDAHIRIVRFCASSLELKEVELFRKRKSRIGQLCILVGMHIYSSWAMCVNHHPFK